ncbi:MAG: hypothetical protein KC620_19135, partial [Myxococcales bacterium]|nr:hypothetical protein [Myxococcales bacterium]
MSEGGVMKAMAILAALALMLGCDDSAGSKGAVTGDTGGADMGLVDDAALPVDMARPRRDHAVPAADMGMGAATPAYVELTLAPRRPLYTRQEHPQVNATVFDRIGREIPDFPLRFDVQPGAAGTIDADGRLTFLAEGAGAVRGCVTSELCGRASFFVDDGPPPLVIETPARGAILSGDPQIEIRGHTEVAENTRVFINDRPVELDEQGGFTYTMRAELGLNRIDTIADDGVRRPPTRDTR